MEGEGERETGGCDREGEKERERTSDANHVQNERKTRDEEKRGSERCNYMDRVTRVTGWGALGDTQGATLLHICLLFQEPISGKICLCVVDIVCVCVVYVCMPEGRDRGGTVADLHSDPRTSPN